MSEGRPFEAPELIEVMDEAVRYNRFLLDQILEWRRPLQSILDFGAGNGRFARALTERKLSVEVVEPDPSLRRRIEGLGIRGHESLSAVPDATFDGIYTINVLEHLQDDRACLREFRRVVRPGGGLFVYVPAFPLLYSANDARVGHVRRYRQGELVRKVREAGFTVERVRHVDSLGFFAGLAYRAFGAADGDLDVRAVRAYDRLVFPASRLLDRPLGPFLGKNLLLRATRRPDPAHA